MSNNAIYWLEAAAVAAPGLGHNIHFEPSTVHHADGSPHGA